jgi:hypothetical protein
MFLSGGRDFGHSRAVSLPHFSRIKISIVPVKFRTTENAYSTVIESSETTRIKCSQEPRTEKLLFKKQKYVQGTRGGVRLNYFPTGRRYEFSRLSSTWNPRPKVRGPKHIRCCSAPRKTPFGRPLAWKKKEARILSRLSCHDLSPSPFRLSLHFLCSAMQNFNWLPPS